MAERMGRIEVVVTRLKMLAGEATVDGGYSELSSLHLVEEGDER